MIKLIEQPHDAFKRHGADLYIKRDISLSEALCGFQLEIEHLDKRKLIIKSAPGQVTRPVSFDPFKDDAESDKEWETIDNAACDLEPMARADLDDVEKLKQVIAKGQLKGKGVEAFSVHNGSTVFYQASRDEVMAAKKCARPRATPPPPIRSSMQMMKTVKLCATTPQCLVHGGPQTARNL
jgi:hypothetical protein